MRQVLVALIVGAAPFPALAQHEGHSAPAEQPADPHAGHQAPQAEPQATPAPPSDPPAQAGPHAGHNMPVPAAQPEPHAGHDPAAPAPADPHAGHQPGEAMAPATAPPPPEALSGPVHAADQVYGSAQMEAAREEVLRREHGGALAHRWLIDRAEAKIGDGPNGYAWSGQAWFGGDIDKAWFKTDGEGEFDRDLDTVEIQALWARAIDPWFDVQLGVRHDFDAGPDRSHLVAGVQGLAPYWFDVEAALFLSGKGDVTARFEGESDLRVTQQLILQPRIEFDLAAQDIEALGIGAGLSTAEAGLRLRYEFQPQFAPYVGVQYERAFGETRDLRRADGEEAGAWVLLVGMRAWF